MEVIFSANSTPIYTFGTLEGKLLLLFKTKAFIEICAFMSYLFIEPFVWKEIWLAILIQCYLKAY